MSSGTRANVGQVGQVLRGPSAPGLVQEGGGPTDALTERQQLLGHLWAFYRCMNYHQRQTDWDGRQATGHIENEAIATAGFIPGGFYDAGNSTLPLKFRKPTAPYYLAKVIVNRFTGLLFGSQHHPKLVVVDDPDTDAWLTAVIESTRLWSRMVLARSYGGAMGTVAIGFVFRDGKPKIEVHDPRWCFPHFADREELVLEKIEKRYQYPDMTRDAETGLMVEGWFWYRRIITETDDTLWPRVPVNAGEEPRWTQHKSIVTTHDFGFCPVVWVQNNEVQDDIDGDPDCHGVYDNIETIDSLLSQANRGILSNCDPTLHISTDDDIPDGLRKGSDNAIKTSSGGSVSYLEISGAGPKAALEFAAELEKRVLRITRCVLDDNFSGPARTEAEVTQNYSNMIEQADILREQYGERGVKRLLEMLLRAARKLSTPVVDRGGDLPRIMRSVIRLPRTKEGTEHQIGKGQMLELDWPDWAEPTLTEITSAVDAAGKAMNYGLTDLEHGVRFIAHYFGIEDTAALVEKLEAATAAADPAAAYDTAYEEPVEEEIPVEEPVAEEEWPVPGEVADALNGAQVNALIGVLSQVYAGTLPAVAAAEVILNAFPQVSEESVNRMLSEKPTIKPVTDATPETGKEPAAPEEPALPEEE